MLLAIQGDHDRAIAEIKIARDLDPMSPIVNADVAWVYYYAGRFDDAIEQCHKILEFEPDFSVAHWDLGQSLREKGMFDEAIAALERADELSGGNEVFRATLAHALGLAGRRAEAVAILDEFLARSSSQFVAPHAMVLVYLGLGNSEKALVPVMDPIRSHPRVQEILRTIKFAKL
jgi:tetratricopeptide (TPR) repeat protein